MMHRVSVWIVLEPDHDYAGKVQSVRADRMVLSRPPRLNSRQIALKVNINIEGKVFEQFLPEVDVAVTEARTFLVPTVEIDEPVEQLTDGLTP